MKKKGKRGRPKKPKALKAGTKRWASYKPGRRRLYQLQKVVGRHGGVTPLSPWMTSAEAKMWIRGYNRALGRRKGRISFKR